MLVCLLPFPWSVDQSVRSHIGKGIARTITKMSYVCMFFLFVIIRVLIFAHRMIQNQNITTI